MEKRPTSSEAITLSITTFKNLLKITVLKERLNKTDMEMLG